MRPGVSSLVVVLFVACAVQEVLAAPPPDARLNAYPFVVGVGQPVTLSGFVGTGTALPAILAFGDGQQQIIDSPTFSTTHEYGRPGSVLPVLKTDAGAFITGTSVEVAAYNPQLPLGSIYATTVAGSPVLAGSVVTVSLTYRLALPSDYPVLPGQQAPGMQVIIDLEDANGALVRRSDPIPLHPLSITAVETRSFSYSVPVDAAGQYRMRAFIQAVDRGTVAVGEAIPLDITGNDQTDGVGAKGTHAAGTVEAGHRPQVQGETVNPGITLSHQRALSTTQAGASSDPISNRVDGLLVLTSLLPTILTSPNALDTQPKQPASLPLVGPAAYPQYFDAAGRSMAPMPRILGGFATVRGANAVYRTAPGWTFQGSVGNTELYTTTVYNSPLTFEQVGDVFELGRFWTPEDRIEFFHHGRGDIPSRFKIYPQQPQRADVNALAASHGFGKDFSLAASAAASTYQANYSGTKVSSDSADLVNASYHTVATDVQIEYHNFGPFYTPGSGLEALSDRVGTIASFLAPIGRSTQMGVNWDHEQTRSVSQTQTTSTAFVDTIFLHGTDARVEFSRDRELTQVADLTTGTVGLHIGRGDAWHSFFLDGSIVSAHDYVDDRNSSTSRFGSVQYSFQQGVQAIGLGVTASQFAGLFPRTVVNESLTDGLDFGGHQRRIGVQMGLTNSNTSSRGFGTISTDLTGSLTYRIVRGVTCGLKAERTLFHGPAPQLDTLAGGMRFMLVVER